MRIAFEIFEEQERFIWTKNIVIYSSLLICVSIAWMLSKTNFELLENIFKGLAISILMLAIYFKITQHTKYKKLNGKLVGKIEFQKDRIKIIDREINLEQIKNLDFEFDDHEGNYFPPMVADLNPALSNGVNNWVKIELSTGEKIDLKIKVNYEGQQNQLKEYLIEYMNAGKISSYRVASILGLKNYREIQLFKRSNSPNA